MHGAITVSNWPRWCICEDTIFLPSPLGLQWGVSLGKAALTAPQNPERSRRHDAGRGREGLADLLSRDVAYLNVRSRFLEIFGPASHTALLSKGQMHSNIHEQPHRILACCSRRTLRNFLGLLPGCTVKPSLAFGLCQHRPLVSMIPVWQIL
jgi:hypothetical protein